MGIVPVNRPYVASRLAAVRASLARLQAMRGRGGAGLLEDLDEFAIAEHHLRRALESTLDVARHVLAKDGTFKPGSYAELVEGLGRLGAIPAGLTHRARDLAEQRNRLVHLGPEVSREELWALIDGPIDCLQDFCAHLEGYLAAKES